jgi:HlyD family secretion protein
MLNVLAGEHSPNQMRFDMHRTRTVALIAVGLVAVGGAIYEFHAAPRAARVTFAPVSRADVVETVECAGTVSSPETVTVGSQVSGVVVSLGADFNSLVHKGDVLAKIDPTAFDTAVKAAEATLAKATADAEGAQVAVDDARRQAERARLLESHDDIPPADLESANATLEEAEAQLKSATGAVAQAKGALEQAHVDLAHTVITSPLDGLILARQVDVGQTVAAGYETPALFSVAGSLNRVELMAQVDEGEIGNVRAGEPVRFHVDAYPDREFTGRVSQVRLEPAVDLLNVTYTVVIAAENADLSLRPGMTATIAIEAERHLNTLRVPAPTLRFRPTFEVLRALGESDRTKDVTKVPDTTVAGSRVQVWVGSPTHIEPRTVTTGVSDGRFTEIVGLAEGTPVAAAAWFDKVK